jgi:hypothetical protein
MAMTQKLQTLLFVGLYHTKKGFDAYPHKEWMSFSYVCDKNLEVKEDWEIKNLLDKLTHDGYIETKMIDDVLHYKVNQVGHDFITKGGYNREYQEHEIDWNIKVETLKKFKYDKKAYIISILSMVISLLTLLYSLKEPLMTTILKLLK